MTCLSDTIIYSSRQNVSTNIFSMISPILNSLKDRLYIRFVLKLEYSIHITLRQIQIMWHTTLQCQNFGYIFLNHGARVNIHDMLLI